MLSCAKLSRRGAPQGLGVVPLKLPVPTEDAPAGEVIALALCCVLLIVVSWVHRRHSLRRTPKRAERRTPSGR